MGLSGSEVGASSFAIEKAVTIAFQLAELLTYRNLSKICYAS